MSQRTIARAVPLLSLLLVLLPPAKVWGWVDSAWPFRRPVDVSWEPQTSAGNELAVVDFYSSGHCLPGAADVRVATEDNHWVASHVLWAGPGDRVRVVFALIKPAKRYYVYFGNPNPAAPRPGLEDVKYLQGLLTEMRIWTGGAIDNFKQVEASWERSQPVIGRTILDKAFLGMNPFGDQEQTIMKMTGALSVPVDGEYTFAMSADDRAALYLDGEPVLFCAQQVGDVRINAKHVLTKGSHPILLYHVNAASEMRLSVAWLGPGGAARPGGQAWRILGRDALGGPIWGSAGALEEIRKTLTADFDVSQEGECFFANGYSHRYRFAAYPPKVSARLSYNWDFGDGQTASVPETQHVYLADGVYPVKLTVHAGVNSDTQTIAVAVSRDYEHLDKAREDDLAVHARMVESYDPSREPANWLPRVGWLGLRAENIPAMLPACEKLAPLKQHVDATDVLKLFAGATRLMAEKGDPGAVPKFWETIPVDSDLQPTASRQYAQLLLWRSGDFAKAVRLLQPYAEADPKDPAAAARRRMYAQAILLDQKPDAARKLLEALPTEGDPNHQAAISGAAARTVEYYITQGDWETGDEAWEQWQARHPGDFLQGYSVLLKTKLIELAKAPAAAAKVAEAFATAVPASAYSPQLLDRASKLLSSTDPGKSQALRKMLKDRYPEDPLSQ